MPVILADHPIGLFEPTVNGMWNRTAETRGEIAVRRKVAIWPQFSMSSQSKVGGSVRVRLSSQKCG
jgi:hypothetical protein